MITTITTHFIAAALGFVGGALTMANNTDHADGVKSTAADIWARTKTAWTWIRTKVRK